MKINYQTAQPINKPGTWIVMLQSGSTRTEGKLYQVIKDPKATEWDPKSKFIHYVSDKGTPVKISFAKWKTLRRATDEEIAQVKKTKSK